MNLDKEELYQAIIADHDGRPRGYGELADVTHSSEIYNPLCGDRYTVYLRLVEDRLEAVSFSGRGCAVSRASASIMTTLAQGRSATEIVSLIRAVDDFLLSGGAPGSVDIEDLIALQGIHRFPVRRACARLAWTALERAAGPWLETRPQAGT